MHPLAKSLHNITRLCKLAYLTNIFSKFNKVIVALSSNNVAGLLAAESVSDKPKQTWSHYEK